MSLSNNILVNSLKLKSWKKLKRILFPSWTNVRLPLDMIPKKLDSIGNIIDGFSRHFELRVSKAILQISLLSLFLSIT